MVLHGTKPDLSNDATVNRLIIHNLGNHFYLAEGRITQNAQSLTKSSASSGHGDRIGAALQDSQRRFKSGHSLALREEIGEWISEVAEAVNLYPKNLWISSSSQNTLFHSRFYIHFHL